MNDREEYSKPDLNKGEFTCLFDCDQITKQSINKIKSFSGKNKNKTILREIVYSVCAKCSKFSFWIRKYEHTFNSIGGWSKTKELEQILLYPIFLKDRKVSPYMEDNEKKLFNEASMIYGVSPKAAAALLRVVFESIIKRSFPEHKKLFIGKILEQKDVEIKIGSNLIPFFKKIKNIGNEGSHSFKMIYEDDDIQEVSKMFKAINIALNKLIIEPLEEQEFIQDFKDN